MFITTAMGISNILLVSLHDNLLWYCMSNNRFLVWQVLKVFMIYHL
jgi:hypothetical protein